MYRLIIVDDEPHIRKGLRSVIEWDEFGIEVVAEAENGAEALKLIPELHPHIILLDISMPQMHGLDFLEHLKLLSKAPKTIVLSGYSNFDYVRQAMKLGAQNYLLKPVDTDELKSTLIEVIDSISGNPHDEAHDAENLQVLKSNTLNRILEGKIELKELREKCLLLDIGFRSNHMRIGMISLINLPQTPAMLSSALALCETMIPADITGYFVADRHDNIVFIALADQNHTSEKIVVDFLNECAQMLQARFSVECVVAYGGPAASYSGLPRSYQEAIHMQEFKLAWGDQSIGETYLTNSQSVQNDLFYLDTLASHMEKLCYEEVASDLHRLFSNLLALYREDNSTVIKFHIVELISRAAQTALKCRVSLSDVQRFKHDAYLVVRNTFSLPTLETELCKMVTFLLHRMDEIMNASYSPAIQNAVQYITEHYDDYNLSLKTLAAKMNINAAYLGRQFSMETGEYFSNFLNEIRIQHAKELLKNPSCKIARVAEMVGFTNITYFHAVFKKITGYPPGAARKMNRTEENK